MKQCVGGWSDASDRIGHAVPVTFRFRTRGAADTRVSVSQTLNQVMSRIEPKCVTKAPYGAETSLLFRGREQRAQCTVRSAVDGALLSINISSVHLTRVFRAKRASGGLRRAPVPVQLRSGIRSISAWPGRHMAPASLRMYTVSRLVPLVAPTAGVVSRPGCLSRKNASPRAARSAAAELGNPTRAISRFWGCPHERELQPNIASW